MKLANSTLLLLLCSSPIYAELMPWETPSHKDKIRNQNSAILSSLPIEELSFTGTIFNDTAPTEVFALVTTPQGHTLKIDIGTKIGMNQGVLTEIGSATVSIMERIPNCGTATMKPRSMKISVPGTAPKGTTIRYQSNERIYICE
jgi:Tfp pilus assembly protein PilP